MIGDQIDGAKATVAEGVPVHAESGTHATIQLPVQRAAVVKVEGELDGLGDVRRAQAVVVPCAEGFAQQVAVACGSLQAPRRRPRTEEEEGQVSQRPRRLGPATWQPGERISYDFDHDGRNTAFSGTIVSVNAEARRCDVRFDDGSSHSVDLRKLTRLAAA